MTLTATRMPFATWLPDFWARWQQGQHVSLIGPTGQGKTVLTRKLLPRRSFVAVLASKPRDDGLDRMISEDGYRKVESWAKRPKPIRMGTDARGRAIWQSRIMLWPRMNGLLADSLDEQYQEYRACLSDAMAEGGWCIVADDVSWQVEMLDLGRELKAVWKLGRSSGISLVANIQRPAFVPHDAYSAASHLMLWQNSDERDTRTLSGLGGLPAEPIRAMVRTMPEHEFLNIEPRAKLLTISKVA